MKIRAYVVLKRPAQDKAGRFKAKTAVLDGYLEVPEGNDIDMIQVIIADQRPFLGMDASMRMLQAMIDRSEKTIVARIEHRALATLGRPVALVQPGVVGPKKASTRPGTHRRKAVTLWPKKSTE